MEGGVRKGRARLARQYAPRSRGRVMSKRETYTTFPPLARRSFRARHLSSTGAYCMEPVLAIRLFLVHTSRYTHRLRKNKGETEERYRRYHKHDPEVETPA